MNLSSPLSLFLLASVAIHTGVVMVSNNTTAITLPGSQGSVMAIKISPSNSRVKTHKQVKKDIPDKTKQKVKTTTAISPSKAAKVLNEVTQKKQIKSASQKTASLSQARVISVINNKLRQHFVYPKLAQKRNWQGKVLVSLQITENGDIKNIQLSQSSGYSVLDNAAMNSLRKIKNIAGMSSWLSNDIVLHIPVIYQLTRG